MDSREQIRKRVLPRRVRRLIEAERGPERPLSAEAETQLDRSSLIDLARKSVNGAVMYPLLTGSVIAATGLHQRSGWLSLLLLALLTAQAVHRVLVSRRVLSGNHRPGDRTRIRLSMHSMGWTFALFCVLAIGTDGTVDSGFFAIVLMVGFTLGGALIIAQEGPHAWLFALGVMLPPLGAITVTRPPHALVIGVCFGLCMIFVLRISRVLHDEYWLAQIRRTVLRQQSIELRAAQEAAEQAVETQEEFVRNISHEMRTPMNGVLGMLELAQVTDNVDEIRELLTHAQRSAETMVSLVDTLLAFGGEIEHLPVRREVFDPAVLGRDVLDTYRHRAESKEIELVLQTGDHLPGQIECDRERLRQLLDALVSNAIKFTADGRVTLRLDAQRQDSEWSLKGEVEDTGIGIAPEHREKIFEPFRQLDTGVTRAYDGLGIGLPVARRLAKQLHGWLDVDSVLGRGSRFFFEVAVQAAEAAEPAESASGAGI